jgi:GT2 family glycosyltransferase
VTGEVGIVILNWNNWEDTIECVKSVLKLRYNHYFLFIVDNFSTDHSIAEICNYLRENNVNFGLTSELNLNFFTLEKSNVTIVKSGYNKGYSGGNNIALKYIIANNLAEYIWLLNNDTVVDENALLTMVEMADSDPAIGIVGSKILDFQKRDQIQTAGGGKVDYSRGITAHIGLFQPQNWDEQEKLDFVTGASMLIKRQLIERIGYLNDAYFLYWEDVDYSFRTVENGYKLAYCKNSMVWHKESATTGRESVHLYYKYRNALYFFSTHKHQKYIHTLGRLILRAIRLSCKDTPNKRYYRRAVIDYLLNIKGEYNVLQTIQGRKVF